VRLILAASEAVPYCKTGGLADVAGALSDALAQRGHDVLLILPLYRVIREKFPNVKFTGKTVFVAVGDRHERVDLWEDDSRPGVRVIFIRCDAYFDRAGIYGESAALLYADNDRRYALFSRAIFEAARGVGFRPEVIHVHDWQTGLVPAYQRFVYRFDHYFRTTATVFTIHNLAYQGNFPPASMAVTGLAPSTFSPAGLEFYGQVSYMKSALVYADALNTVSPTYARETMSDHILGCGMEGILKGRAERYRGIVNGLDETFWNPETDQFLEETFGPTTLAKRAVCKAALQKHCGFRQDKATPLLGFIGRMDHQKGVDHLIDVAPPLLAQGVQLVTLGHGHEQYVRALKMLRERYPSQVFVENRFAEPFAHEIYGGVDLFLMPSRYEPCGLGQMIAMRYGAIPIVTPTGGLLDTVKPVARKGGTGFIAADHTSGAFQSAVLEGMALLEEPRRRAVVQKNAMTEDRSWDRSVNEYEELYASAISWAVKRT